MPICDCREVGRAGLVPIVVPEPAVVVAWAARGDDLVDCAAGVVVAECESDGVVVVDDEG